MIGAYAAFTLAGLFGLGIAWLLIDKAISVTYAWRERQAMRVRDEQINRFCMGAFKGTKENKWWLS